MAESSDGPQTARWKCVDPNCKFELPKNLPAMRFCPECGTQQTQRKVRKPTPPISQQRNEVHEPDRIPETYQPPPKPPATADDSASQSAFSDANPIVAASTTSKTGSSDPSHTFQTSSESVSTAKPQSPISSPLPEEDCQLPKSREIATVGQNGSSNSRNALVTGKVNMESHKDTSSSADALPNVDHSRVSDTTQGGKSKTMSGERKEEKENQEGDAKNGRAIKKVGVDQKKGELEQKENGTTFVDPLRSASTGSSCSDSKGGTPVSTKFQKDMVPYRKPTEAGNLIEPSPAKTKKSQSEEANKGASLHHPVQAIYDYSKHSGANKDLKGLMSPHEKSILVTFHCIVPKLHWQWDESSCIHMRFEGDALGNWKHNVGDFKKARNLEDDMHEMVCSLRIDADVLKHPLEYKYVIFSPKMTEDNECYEKLHYFQYDDPNRCLKMSPQALHSAYGGEYHHHDFLVYPRITRVPRSFFDQMVDTGKGIWRKVLGRSSQVDNAKEVDISTMSMEDMAKKCLHFYLDPYMKYLVDEKYSADFKIHIFVQRITDLYFQHLNPSVMHRKCLTNTFIEKEIKRWVEDVVSKLLGVQKSQHQFISAMCIACCIVECKIPPSLKMKGVVIPLFQMLKLQKHDIRERITCLKDVTPSEFWSTMASAIKRLCKEAMTDKPVWDWLYILPLYHFMKDSKESIMIPEYDPTKILINAREKDLGLGNMKNKVPLGFVDQYYSSLEPLFTVDQLLLHDFIYLCRDGDYPKLFGRIPPHLSLMCLYSHFCGIKYLTRDNANEYLEWLERINSKVAEESVEECQVCVATMDAALHLFLNFIKKLARNFGHYIDVLKMIISVLLFALTKVKVYVTQRKVGEEKITNALGKCGAALKDWVINVNVIGGSSFGGNRKGDSEVKLWESLLSLKTPNDEGIAERWDKTVKAVIEDRVRNTPVMVMLSLVPLLKEESHPTLSSALMDGGMQAIDKIVAEPHKYSHASVNLEAFASMESMKVGALFGHLLLRKYPRIERGETFDISLEDLLTWSHWPFFIKIYRGESKLKEGLSEACQLACSCAVSQLEDISKKLHAGEISMLDLQKIQEKQHQMNKLCEAAVHEKDKQLKQISMVHVMKLRLEEFNSFTKQQSVLLQLCQKVDTQVKGISEAKKELEMDFRSCKINTLCVRRGSNIEVLRFTTASCLQSFAWMFDVMTKKVNSSIFNGMWCSFMQLAYTSNPSMSIRDVEGLVWIPTFQGCFNMLEELYNRSMSLANVDKHFKKYRDQCKLESEIKALFYGVNQCLQKYESDDGWIHFRVLRIQQYWKLHRYRDAANSFLSLRDSLGLTTGDFTDVERISKEVSSSMTNQTLNDINAELVETGKFLSDFTGENMECIKVFTECQKIVQWIQDTTKDVSDLQNFVNVALATAAGGEDDYANDKLSCLRTVGSGFSSLIYKLAKDTGFQGLAKRCLSVWDAYTNDNNLPKMLVDCNKNLEWYKSVKETQGSVEVTSFGQMENILHYGHYTVGGKRNMAMHSIHDVISLTLEPQGGKKLIKTSYNLNELRDLESKLVLITGSKAENRTAVEHFLNTLHCVCRIAEVLITLQQVGNVKYIGWSMKFYCQPSLVEDLQKQAKVMEDELDRWNKEVAEARRQFYELNYYTTRQLLVLRSELGKMKNPGSTIPQQAQVMALLESISSEIHLTNVMIVVQQVVSEGRKSLDLQGSPIPVCVQAATADVELPVDSISPVSLIGKSPPPTVERPVKAARLQSLPLVSLSKEELNEKQRQYFINIIEHYEYHEMTALKAIEEVGTGDWNDIENWVQENGDKYEELFQEEEVEEEDDKEADESGEEDEGMSSESDQDKDIGRDEEKASLSTAPSQSPHASPSCSHIQTRVVITHRQPLDETNEEVQKLLEAEMGTPEECIRAVETYGTAEAAMNHIMEMDEGGLFHDVKVPMQYSVAEPPIHIQQTVIRSEEINITLKGVEDQYLMLNELGRVLYVLSCNCPAAVQKRRTLSENILKSGQPHLIVVPPDRVLRAALSLYMEDINLPMPTPEEMLICNQHTSAEEVTILWQRAVFEPEFKRIFCLVHAEKLSYQTTDKALRSLSEIIQGRTDYRLVIICSGHEEDKSPIISKLHLYRRPYGVPADINKYRAYLRSHFVDEEQPSFQQLQTSRGVMVRTASVVDPEGSCVRVVSSTRAGMGKTLFITRMAEKLQSVVVGDNVHITIPIHGPQVTTDSIMQYLVNGQNNSHQMILHFDISPSVLWQVDTILFSLLIQRGLCDSQGHVWRNHSTQLYAIEVTLPEIQPGERQPISERFTLSVLEMLPSVKCFSPKHALPLMARGSVPEGSILMDEEEFRSEAYQRVYQYLRRHVMNHNLDRFSYSKESVEGSPNDCLQVILNYCGVKDPSWAEIRHFVKFLDLQLQSCECSSFCNEDFVGDVMAGLKSFVVKFMIRMSRDFSTSSLRGEVAQENEEVEQNEDTLGQYQIVERKEWEKSSHPYIFFNQDGVSITFVGFMVTSNGDLIDPAHRGGTLERGIMTQQLYTGLRHQRVDFNDDYRKWNKEIMIQKISTVMGIEWPYDPDETYVLTVDNLIKILAIQMRFRCGIPVVIMGETGCGKTRLIRFMCDLAAQGGGKRNMLILKVHGGISENDIKTFMTKAEDTAKENRAHNLDTVVFFDEANTTEAIGLIKEIMCDRRMCGKPISQDLKFIAACNPYRRHSERMIEKLRSAGLGFYVRETDTQQKLGKIPLRELVYRVIDLPPSMRPLVYDFGQLTSDTEKDYTEQIVHDHVKKHSILSQQHDQLIPAIAQVLAWSQRYMREKKDECSFVSLRDVERAMLVFVYFFEKMDLFRDAMNRKESKEKGIKDGERRISIPVPGASRDPDILIAVTGPTTADTTRDLTRSLILAISVCYHARLSDRTHYEKEIAQQFKAPLALSGGVEQFRNEIRWCQEVLLESMVLGENIARNAALRENVFMMAICVDLRIPLFLVGKPGSSKSLAKSIVADSMRGQASQNDLLRSFKQVHMFSYQCSQLSTPQSVIEVFNTAKRFQKNQDTSKYVSVVVLDEVGLAEDSPNLPLKALHPLLEDGTEGADENAEVVDRNKRVAFIGISNWALDPAKMNRGVMVTRGDPDTKELVVSAQGICHNEKNDEVNRRLSSYFEPLAEAYSDICKHQKRQFFGLRDFYSLIKMLYWMCEKTNMPPTGPQLVHAIKRNFGGLQDENIDPEMKFREKLPNNIDESPDLRTIPPEVYPFVNPDNSQRGLINTSLKTKETSWHGENRYLLFLTENYAALEILKQYLQNQDSGHDQQLLRHRSGEATLKPWEMEPFVLFGSSFPRDKEYTQVCRNINQIKICMEIGRTVILLNLENLYESLYDVLNQYYIHHGGNRYVDLGLQTHKVKCRVHEEFKLILIAEKTTVYDEFPTPLINRLEKHFVLYSSVLEGWQTETLTELETWIKDFSHVSNSQSRFKEKDAFVGYHKDVAAAVVFQASSQLRKMCGRWKDGEEQTTRHLLWQTALENRLLGECSLDELVEEEEGSDHWKLAVLLISQYLLLQTTHPAALVRLHNSKIKDQRNQLNQIYQLQHHASIKEFLKHHMLQEHHSRGGLLLQVTTHSHLLSSDEVDDLSSQLLLAEESLHSFLLQEFDTELDFTSKVSPLFMQDSEEACLLIIQCDSGHINGDLIACARYRIYDMRAKALLSKSQCIPITHVLFIIHLPVQAVQSSFVSFQGDPWVSCHIDELRASEEGAITLEGAQGVSISELFYGGLEERRETEPELKTQVSDSTSTSERMLFEHTRSMESEEEEMEIEERAMKMDLQIEDIENEGGPGTSSGSKSVEALLEPMEDEEREYDREAITGKDGLVMPSTENVLGKRSFPEMYTQCVRLNSCIQAAASRLQDSTHNKQRAAERVKLLIDIIPRKPNFPLEPGSFYLVLVSHIHRILKEREAASFDPDWVLSEAMNIHNLQTGGTFKNVLSRKLDNVIIPFFAEIIAFIDRNCNLNLLQTVSPPTPLSQFWLKIFRSERTEQALHYDDMATGVQKVAMRNEEFECEFPFSWLVKELMDSQWDNAQTTGGSSRQQIHRQLCKLVSDTSLGEILMSVQEDGQCEELYRRYIHDFVRSVHKCTHKQNETVKHEYKLIQDTLHNMIVKGDDFSSLDGHVTLTSRIAAVHVVYGATRECIHWFGQLASYNPGILAGMVQAEEQTVGVDDGMMLHLYAVERVLNELKPPIEANRQSEFSVDQTLRQWLSRLQKMSNAIESTLSLPSEHPLAQVARLRWQKIRALQMFSEHVLLNHGNLVVYARRLNLALGEQTNFLECSTVDKVKRALNNMHLTLKKEHKSKEQKKQLTAIRKSCRNFFIEVVSGLCFGQSSAPEDELVEMLLNIVFTEQGQEGEEGGEGEGGKRGTRDLTPYKEDLKERDKSPVIRSFLLQLLLEHDTAKVKHHLSNYFDKSREALVGGVGVDQELCLLCTQCFEDALDKEYSCLALGDQMKTAIQLITSAVDVLTTFGVFTQTNVSLNILEGVAKMRYGLFVVAELLQMQVNEVEGTSASHSQKLYGSVSLGLIDKARCACTEDRLNTIDATGKSNTTGPVVYLLKLLVRQAGFSCLKKIVEKHKWVVPDVLRSAEAENTSIDPFVIYNPVYSPIREEMSAAAYGRDYATLEEHTADLQPQEWVPLLLSVYEVFTLSRSSTQISKQLLPETIEKMNEIILNCKTLPREMQLMARVLVCNEQGGPLAALQVSAGQPDVHHTLSAVVIHTVAALLSRKRLDLLSPLVTLLIKPEDMAMCYLPTMAEDMLPEARRIITGGQFYECRNGHPYFVGECGQPMQQTTCHICGSAIGGQNHRAVSDNKRARTTDTTQTGHSLGHPTARGGVPSPERSLSPAACCIVRAIMHSALLWTSCNDMNATEGLLALVKSGLHGPQALPEFFWGHLERDMQLLTMALGKNIEEAAIVVHLVLQNILTSDPAQGTISMKTLGTREIRDEWEKQFGRIYIHPLLEKLEVKLGNAMATILNDDKQEHDPLFYLVYERTPVVKGSLEPHLWGYRPRITLENLTRYMQQQKTKLPILKEFLKEEAGLRATRYLPHIVELQRRMFELFHHRIDHKVARDRTMHQFISKQRSENVRNEYRQMVVSLQSAWELVRDKLKDHAQLRVEGKYLQHNFGLDTTLDHFIPTTTGAGACTFALVHYLAYVHNNFIDWCRAKSKTSTWQEHKIQLPHIHACHLLNYASQLQSILLSHCHYSLYMGHGHEISYDLPALEKHILDRFIHGKPRILVDIPQVSYQKDVYTAATFASVRKKVAKQISLPARVQLDILRELGSPAKLRKSLDVVEIVLGFLTSGGGKSSTTLVKYLKKLKMEKKTFSEKAKEHCNLEHILSLWQTLSVGLARVITLSGQEPFHTLNSELLGQLTRSQQQKLDQVLPKCDLDSLLGTLYEFIETYIRHIDMREKEWSLLDTLPLHLDGNDLEVPQALMELPESITLAQTVATWKHIVHFQAKQRQE